MAHADEQSGFVVDGDDDLDADEGVDWEVLAPLAHVNELSLRDQVAAFEAVHHSLQDRLARAEG